LPNGNDQHGVNVTYSHNFALQYPGACGSVLVGQK